MTAYEKYSNSDLDLSSMGFERGSSRGGYFCTPVGAKAIGWAGVDGIHFCFIKGFGEMVFSVSPMNLPGDYVHPVAESFEDFLKLLISCGDTALIEQAHSFSEEEFYSFSEEYPPSDEVKELILTIKNEFNLDYMENSYRYILNVQQKFNYRQLKFKKDYFEWAPEEPLVPTAPEWAVYFRTDFFYHKPRERKGSEIPLNKKFIWGGGEYIIPAFYKFSKGIVLDICRCADAEKILKYTEDFENHTDFSENNEEEIYKMRRENPFGFDFSSALTINGNEIRNYSSSWLTYIPNHHSEDEYQSRWVVEHYGLDKSKAWQTARVCFQFKAPKMTEIKNLSIKLVADNFIYPSDHFKTPPINESINITNPADNKEYKLTALDVEQAEMPEYAFNDEEYEWPKYYAKMAYTIEPDCNFIPRDCVQSDQPVKKKKEKFRFAPQVTFASAIAIIGGADGPTAIGIFSTGYEQNHHETCSSCRFEPASEVEWRIDFAEKPVEDIDIELL